MKPISQKAQRTFDKIIFRMNGANHVKIGEDGKAFMPLVVERLGTYDIGQVYSLAHYFEQFGDLCQDPEMTFLKHKSGKVYPMSFQQAMPPIYQPSMFWADGWKVRPRMQADHAAFAGHWLENIKHQQDI